MTTNLELTPPGDKQGKVVDTVIRIGALALLVIWCFLILQPFLIPIVWAIIIAVAIQPLYERLDKVLSGRDKLAAFLVTIFSQCHTRRVGCRRDPGISFSFRQYRDPASLAAIFHTLPIKTNTAVHFVEPRKSS